MAKITVESCGVEIPVEAGETIMSALHRNGYSFLLGCRRGGCGICKIQVNEGEVEHNRPIATTTLSEDERAEKVCLGCRAVPQGDVTITLMKSALRVTNPMLHPRSVA